MQRDLLDAAKTAAESDVVSDEFGGTEDTMEDESGDTTIDHGVEIDFGVVGAGSGLSQACKETWEIRADEKFETDPLLKVIYEQTMSQMKAAATAQLQLLEQVGDFLMLLCCGWSRWLWNCWIDKAEPSEIKRHGPARRTLRR